MALPDHRMLMGMTLGAVSALALAAAGPGFVTNVFAQDNFRPFDPSKLVIFEDKPYEVDYEDGALGEAESQTTIRKIEFGRTSFVTVTRTANGSYSSEALFSKHIRYPGVHVRALPYDISAVGLVSAWEPESGWTALPLANAGSILLLVPNE